MGANHTAADHQNAAGRNTGHAAQQNTAPPIGFLQGPSAHLRGQPAGHLGHRCKQRQSAARIGYGFKGNGSTAAGQKIMGLIGIGGQMQIGEQKLPFAQHFALSGLRLFDFDDHFTLGKNLSSGFHHFSASLNIGGIRKTRAKTCAGFYVDYMATRDKILGEGRGQSDPEFLWFNFFWTTDVHFAFLILMPQGWRIFQTIL